MKNRFLVISVKDLVRCGVFALAVLGVVSVATKGVNRVVETSASGQRLLPIYSVERSDNKVALTFDCAWGADDIPSIVETLEENDVRATFFAVGTWVDKYPEAVKLLAEAGHDIGNHSNSHAHVNKMSYEANLEDMQKCNEKIETLAGDSVTLYRGPYGEYNNTVIRAAKDLHLEIIQWDVDTLDYLGKSPDEMCQRIEEKIRSGSIILMHNDTDYTAKGLQQIIDKIQGLGYEIVPVSELIYTGEYTIDSTGRQKQK
ncbi:MAG: polysaccharide deacetylase family protein [Clostridia bacterium]|nr:polysaccharide deacetylase family protein [Clostridia bacterium]